MSSLDVNSQLKDIDNLLLQAQEALIKDNETESKRLTGQAFKALAEIKNKYSSEISSHYEEYSNVLQGIGGKIKILEPSSFGKYQNILALLSNKRAAEAEAYSGDPMEDQAIILISRPFYN